MWCGRYLRWQRAPGVSSVSIGPSDVRPSQRIGIVRGKSEMGGYVASVLFVLPFGGSRLSSGACRVCVSLSVRALGVWVCVPSL